jgi:hypothetical protein
MNILQMMLDERISLLKTKLLSFEEYEIVCFVEKGENLIPPSTHELRNEVGKGSGRVKK